MAKFQEIVIAQGGSLGTVDGTVSLPLAPVVEDYEAATDGYVVRVEPRTIGNAVVAMGGGRRTIEQTIDPAVGLVIPVKPGDRVKRGQVVATIHARDDSGAAVGRAALDRAIAIEPESEGNGLPLVSHRVTDNGVEEL